MSFVRPLVPVLAAVCLLSAGCSSSSSSGGPSGAPQSRSAPPKSAEAPASAGTGSPSTANQSATAPSHSRLAAIVVQPSELPAGWKGTKPDPEDPSDQAFETELYACVGSSGAGAADKIEEVQSDDYSKDNDTVSSDVTSYRSESDVQAQIDVLDNPKANGCLNTAFNRSLKSALPAGTAISQASIKLNPGQAGGISNLAGTAVGKATVTVQGQTVTVYLAVAFITGPQLTGTVSFSAVGRPLPGSFTGPLVTAVAERAANP